MNSLNSYLLPPVARVFSLVIMAMALQSCSSDEKVESSGPHILFLTVDTLRPDYLGMYGYDRDSSPYLDSLLADAFHFPETITTVPRTTPALASMLTGAYPHNNGVRGLHHVLSDDVVPITEILKNDGYQTLAVVTNQVIGPERRLSRGFDAYLHAKDLRGARATTDVALERLQDIDFETPLFLWMHYIDPHIPYVAESEIIQSFDPSYSGDYALNFRQVLIRQNFQKQSRCIKTRCRRKWSSIFVDSMPPISAALIIKLGALWKIYANAPVTIC